MVGDFGLEVESVDRFELTGALSAEDRGDGVVTLDADDDAIRPAWEDPDGDALLEPTDGSVEGVSGINRVERSGPSRSGTAPSTWRTPPRTRSGSPTPRRRSTPEPR